MPRDFGQPMREPMYKRESRPKGIKNLIPFLYKQVKNFLSRLFYIVSLVWESSPSVLVWMAAFCVLNGVLPVIGAYISKELLNGIAALLTNETISVNLHDDVFVTLRPVLFLLLFEFIYLFTKRILDSYHVSQCRIV